MATIKLAGIDFPQNATTEEKVLYVADVMLNHKKTLEWVIEHMAEGDGTGGGDTVNNYYQNPPTDVTNSPITLIDLYDNGMYTEYQDDTEYDWSFGKDGDGRIILIINNTTTVQTLVNWNEGVK